MLNIWQKSIDFWDMTMHVMKIGWDGCNLIKTLDKDPKANRVNINGKIYNSIKMRIIMNALEGRQIKILNLGNNRMDHYSARHLAEGLRYTNIKFLHIYNSNIGSEGTKYLADILKDTCITHLTISDNHIADDGVKYLATGLKNTNVISLDLGNNGITKNGIKYLADALQYTNLISISLSNEGLFDNFNHIEDDGVKYLSEHLKQTNITHLYLGFNKISNIGARYLSYSLRDSCVTYISLMNKNIDNNGIQYLARTLQDTQIIKINFGCIDIANHIKVMITEATSKSQIKATKIQGTFQKLVALNTHTNSLEFIIPNEVENLDMAEYLYIIQTINGNPNSKGYIFDIIIKNHRVDFPDNIINNINEFVEAIPNKFNTFFNENLSSLVTLLDNNYDYVNLVKQFENMKLPEIVQNLLLHRALYYVDEDSEILYPYVYTMLDKYSLPLYNEQLEPNKKEEIISYYQDHREIDGAEEIINLLELKSLHKDSVNLS